MNDDVNICELEKELNAQCLLYMHFVNLNYYKGKYEKASNGSTLSSIFFGSDNELKKYQDAKKSFFRVQLELNKAGYFSQSINRISYLIKLLFGNDVTYESRIRWGIQFVLSVDSLFERVITESAFLDLSIKIGFSDNALLNFLNAYKENWSKIQINYSANRNTAIAVGVIAFIGLTILTHGLASIAPGPIGQTLSILGGGTLASGGLGIAGGSALLGLVSAAGAATIGGVTYKFKNSIDKKIILKTFKRMSLEELSFSLAASMTFIQFSRILNGYNTSATQDALSLLIDIEADIKSDYLINYNGQNDDLKSKNMMLRNAFVKLEKCF